MKSALSVLLCFFLCQYAFGQEAVVVKANELTDFPSEIKEALDEKLLKYKVFVFDNAEELHDKIVTLKYVRFELVGTGIPSRNLTFEDSNIFAPGFVHQDNSPEAIAYRAKSAYMRLKDRLNNETFSLSVTPDLIMGSYSDRVNSISIRTLTSILGAAYPTKYVVVHNDRDIRPNPGGSLCGVGMDDYTDLDARSSLVFPNPAVNEKVNIVFHSAAMDKMVHLDVFDETGKVVYRYAGLSGNLGKLRLEINPSHFVKTGLYYYRLNNGLETFHKKFFFNK